ncbi:hypothetical protein [Palleronia pelagia]|uniref:hypothetical protein n=1 Tax=Palleronia pelagia TaxID=387096 RepID=UPI001113FDD9|nr:hypothetical protein [Palleronia pelagia]
MGDALRGSPDYQFTAGGQWIAHPCDIIDSDIDATRPEHFLTAGTEGFDYLPEQYFMHGPPENEVLATTIFSGEHAPETA